jgi:CHAT domain-containing protein/Flp pilus assembly protein TadD
MKPFSSPILLLCLQVLFPCALFSQPESAVIPAIFDSLIQVSRDYTAEAAFDLAFTASAAAGEVAVDCCGEHSVAYASYCFNEGRIRYFMGQNKEAIPWYINSKELRAELLGTMHPDYGKSLNNLAIVYDVMGEYGEAEPIYQEVLNIREQSAGRESVTFANTLVNLSGLYLNLGNYEQAEAYGLEAKGIRERLLGDKHPDYGMSLISLGNLYYLTSNNTRAKNLYLEAKAIYEAQEELDLYTYVDLLLNLGALYFQFNELELAEQYYNEAASLESEYIGTDHQDYAIILNSLAVIYEYTGRLSKAEKNLNQALAILIDNDQENGVDYGYYLQNLGDVYFSQNKIQLSKDIQQQALAILASHLSKNHPRYLRGLRAVAESEQYLQNYQAAEDALRALGELEEKGLTSATRHFSEEELANYTEDYKKNLYYYFAFAEKHPPLADLAYDKIMVYKGFLLQAALQLNQLAILDTTTNSMYKELRDINRELAAQYASPLEVQENVERLETEASLLEKALIRRTADFGNAVQQVTWKEVQNQLQPAEVSIEFIQYPSGSGSTRKSMKYAALLLAKDTQKPVFIPLFSESSLDSLLYNKVESTSVMINSLYSKETPENVLHQLIWEPISKEINKLERIERIYYSPSGLLHRINLGAIPAPDGKTLSRKYELYALGSTRQLVVPGSSKNGKNPLSVAALYGGISYGDIKVEGLTTTETINTSRRGDQGEMNPGNTDGYWKGLPWTEVEITTAKDLLVEAGYETQMLMKEEATEASLKTFGEISRSPGILHLATHGFFFPDPEEIAGEDDLAFRASERSMIRSGLVLADGNYAWETGRPRSQGGEDGILTAYEVSKMDLKETELVILSACETGLGDIKGTEGVYGLQRAFKIAGARYLIMTLWQIPDFQAQAFMTTFYLAWLEEGKTIPEAFRAAQAYMQARYQDPFLWAGFVLLE